MDCGSDYIKMCQKAFPEDAEWGNCLKSQDQLQGMIGSDITHNIKNSMWSILDDFHNFAFATNFEEHKPRTMEQLWLAFVMKSLYQKTWNGEDWIGENKNS